PRTSTWPEVGGSRRPRICSSVVLPTPDFPMSETVSRSRICRSMPFSTGIDCPPSLNSRRSSRASRIAVIGSLVAQRACRIEPRGADRGIDGEEHARDDGEREDHADLVPVEHRGEALQQVDLGVEELQPEALVEESLDRVQVPGDEEAEREAERLARDGHGDA